MFFGRPALTVRSPHRPQPTTPRQTTRAVAPTTTRRRATMCAARVRDTDFSSGRRLGLPAQAPAYYYYTAADDSTYGYDDSAYAYGSDDAYGHAQCTKIKLWRRVHATAQSRPPRRRRDASAMAWRRGLSPLDSARATAFSPRKDSVKNYRTRPTHRFARRLCGG